MDIRHKTLAGLIAIFAVVTIILLVLSLTILPDSYRALETAEVKDDMNQVISNIHDDFVGIEKPAADYGPWDDAYSFVQGTNPSFPDQNLIANTYENLHLNLIVMTDTRGKIVYARSYNFTERDFEPLPGGLLQEIEKEPSPLRPYDTSGVTSGFFLLPGTTIMAASYPILFSNLSGPPAGTLIMGRYLDEAEIRSLGLPSQPPPSFKPLILVTASPQPSPKTGQEPETPILVRPVNEEIIEGSTTLKDITGTDALVISVRQPRDLYLQGKKTIQFYLIVQFALMLILGIFVVTGIDSSVLSRVQRVITDTRAVSDGKATRIRKDGDDEIAQLADALNTMLGRIEQSHTDLRDSEEKFRSFVQESTDGYVLAGSDGRIIEWNSANERITGITRDEAIGTPFIEIQIRLLVPEHRTLERIGAMKKMAESIVSAGTFPRFNQQMRIEILRPDGTRRTLQHTAFPVRISGKRYFGLINRDVTGQRLAEEALQQARRKLLLLNTVTFEDIRNSIFALSGYHSLVRSTPINEKGVEYLEKEDKILRDIDGLLSVAKDYQDLGINPPRWQEVNQVFVFALSHLDTQKISRTVVLDKLEIFADPLLEKVFINLVKNAIMHGGGVTEISLTYQKTGSGIELIFRDNGKGIPAGLKERIFERGYRYGFGLFLIQEILSITGMTIRENGTEGLGAWFTITVPEGMYRFGDGNPTA